MSLSITNSFVAHTTIRSADMNQNFQDVQTAFNNSVAGQTFTNWASWTPTLVGWSGTPTTVARYTQIGKLVSCYVSIEGTSNSTSTSFTLPVSSNTTSMNGNSTYPIARVRDNGTYITNQPGVIDINNGIVTVYKNSNLDAWTASGTKTVIVQFFFEAS